MSRGAAITKVEISRGRSQRVKGVIIGALVGLGSAVALGLVTGRDCGPLPDPIAELLGALYNPCWGKTRTAAFSALS